MCCFAGHVSDVSATDIFVRVHEGRQYVVYQMSFSAEEETAMILPIPIAAEAPPEAVKFVSLERYPDFFRDLERHFALFNNAVTMGGGTPEHPLTVHRVGAFDASFVPSVEHFALLDARFSISKEIWSQVPVYASYGFVVFKLRPGRQVSVHPMAFSFPTRDPGSIYFPTLHIHDGAVHDIAEFDHILYTQNPPKSALRYLYFRPSPAPASEYLDVARLNGLVDGRVAMFQASCIGEWPNEDIIVRISSPSNESR
jgi:hypothetical protein